ncbi:UBN2_3 domain-containing protein [Cephalotus follicularis]|uniref:UBN2_3 domain-containing protein n=1 Tax=Cephalotus follicularis TaxID=3775 RepID=A0A1Q3BZK6_CEPFO|nr:UBN2_3 domain-containing protein [Cephalotus follicularis]
MMNSLVDFNDLLYLHPSDTLGVNLVNEQLVGTENYRVWSRAMMITLTAKNKLGFVDGSCRKPMEGSPILYQWERCNAIVLSWIMNTVSKEIFAGIIYSTDAFSVWKDLKERFNKVNGSRIYALHRKIVCSAQGNLTISGYYSRMRQLWDEYDSLVTLPSCECQTYRAYIEHDQQQKLLQFFMGLNDIYTNFWSQILPMSSLPTLGQAYSLISQEESHRGILSVIGNHSVAITADSPTAFYSRNPKMKKFFSQEPL